ncbi:MAG: hypothetical protein CME06_08535, partial [Gemmatimonadetes bacterium]|nr:hypothetical protein [Gemmatimonadota bacterium]
MSDRYRWLRGEEERGIPSLDPPVVRRVLEGFISNEVRKLGLDQVVLGLSGGIDSAVACVLAAQAL